MSMRLQITQAESANSVRHIRELFLEYAASLGSDLCFPDLCFQNFDKELADLPGAYSPPHGRLLLATVEEQVAGCVALRPLEPGICEMKRLYVRPAYRGQALGKKLVEAVVTEARCIGYERMRLDTVPSMAAAISLYRAIGFREIEPYTTNPIPGALFLELDLRP
jgi:putative acetyltransferase